jgi:hypothetical protein
MGDIPNVVGGGSSVSSLHQPVAGHNDDLSSVSNSNISCITNNRKGSLYHNVPGLSLDLLHQEPTAAVANKFSNRFLCDQGGTVNYTSSRKDYYPISCTCGESSGVRILRPPGGPYRVQVSVPRKSTGDAPPVPADVSALFFQHYSEAPDQVAIGSAELLIAKVIDYAKLEGSIPTSYMISSYLHLCPDPHVVSLFSTLAPQAQVSVIDTAIQRLQSAQRETHPWLQEGDVDPTVQGVVEFCHRLSIHCYFDGGDSRRIDSLALD